MKGWERRCSAYSNLILWVGVGVNVYGFSIILPSGRGNFIIAVDRKDLYVYEYFVSPQ